MSILGIIPARLAATRFPNKPMESILGIPMIGHCYFRSKYCTEIDDLYVATCDNEIVDYVTLINGNAIMTSNLHERATERTAEAMIELEIKLKKEYDIIVMIQGDEPLVYPEMISQVIQPILSGDCQISNLMIKLNSIEDIDNANNVKVVINKNGDALYMSREPIPSAHKYNKKIDYYRQLGLIAFQRDALLNFISLEPTKLEIIESVDMNRLLENGFKIRMVETEYEVDAVDNPIDLIRVEEKMKTDFLFKKYK